MILHLHLLYIYLIRLAELEHRYRSRESRPEDLEAIKELKLTVQEQERKMKELIVSPFTTHKIYENPILESLSFPRKELLQLLLLTYLCHILLLVF